MKTQRKDVVQESKSTQKTGETPWEKKKFMGKCNYCKKEGHKEKKCWFKKGTSTRLTKMTRERV